MSKLLLDSADGGNRKSRAIKWPGGEGEFRVSSLDGTGVALNGGTVTLLELDAHNTSPAAAARYTAHSDETTLTAAGVVRFFAGECYLAVSLTGSGGSDHVAATIAHADPRLGRLMSFATDAPVA